MRLAGEEDVALMLLDAPDALLSDGVPTDDLAALLAGAPCDVALVAGAQRRGDDPDQAVMVPFGGHEHDWAAVEVGAWFAGATGFPLQLIGTRGDPRTGRRDASRLLGHASIALQRGLGITAEPVLVAPGTAGIIAAAERAALVVVGLSDRFAREGLGAARIEIARERKGPGRARSPRAATGWARPSARAHPLHMVGGLTPALSAPTAGRTGRPPAGCTGSSGSGGRRMSASWR